MAEEKNKKLEEKAKTEEVWKVEEAKKGKTDEKKIEKKKVEKKKTVSKESAVVNGYSLKISPKHAIAICKVIKGKSLDVAISRLEDVVKMKRAIPMAGLEVAHQKGKGLSGAKFPRNACVAIIEIIKQVKANAVVNGIENPIIVVAKSDRASAPFRRGGRKSKRTHVHLEVMGASKMPSRKRTKALHSSGNKSKFSGRKK